MSHAVRRRPDGGTVAGLRSAAASPGGRSARWAAGAAVLAVALAASPGLAGAVEIPSELFHQAAATGAVRLVVRLDAPFTPEGDLGGEAEVAAQREAIAAAADALLADLEGTSHRIVRRFAEIPFLTLDVEPAALAALARSRAGIAASEDVRGQLALGESVPLVQGDVAWAAGFDGSGRTVAVLDTGVDRQHPFLAGKVVAEACFSAPDPLFGIPPGCPNGQATQVGTGAAAPCTFSLGGCAHGTHVAGIAAGRTAAGMNGVARGASILAVYVFFNFNGVPSWWGADVAAGLSHVYSLRGTHAIAAANLSLQGAVHSGACDSASVAMQQIKAAIDNLRSAGIATVVASGNTYQTQGIAEPSCLSSAVSVGATTDFDSVAPFSNSGAQLKLLAPGVGIASSVPGGGFNFFDGTSMAAPHVAGAWAILKQHSPGASVDAVLAALTSSGKPVLDTRNGLTRPRIRVYEALRALGFTPPARPRLAVTLAGTGRGTVAGTGIACPSDCEERYDAGAQVTLTATPDSFSRFAGWAGACSGTAPCALAMAADRAVTATFVPQTFLFDTLTVAVTGGGTVTGSGISCPGDCTEGFGRGTVVSLTQQAASGWRFTGWSGACSGTGTCSVTMTGNRSVTATFAANPGGETLRRLTVAVSGAGRVFAAGQLACPPTCTRDYLTGTTVALAAEPGPGAFQGWGGACAGQGNPCRLPMTVDRAVSAAFAAAPPPPPPQATLSVGASSTSPGIPLRVEGPGIFCPPACFAGYTPGTVVTLTARSPTLGIPCFRTYAWSGACAGQGTQCTLRMDASQSTSVRDNGRVSCGAPPAAGVRYLIAGVSGAGAVSGPGIQCRSDPLLDPAGCSEELPSGGPAFALNAVADSGHRFAGWEGSCAGSGSTCWVAAGQNAGAAASFVPLAPVGPGPFPLQVRVVGGGIVTTPAGLACRGNTASQPEGCADLYAGGAQAVLTAEPDDGWEFAGWGGGCAGQPDVCSLNVAAAVAVDALFVVPPPYDLEVAVAGPGEVRGGDRPNQSGCCSHHDGVCGCYGGRTLCCDGSLSPTCNCVQIVCPGDCAETYATFTRVSLGATPAGGAEFSGWGGACEGQGEPCSLGLGADALVEALFRLPQARLDVSLVGDGAVTGPQLACPPGCAAAYDLGSEVTLAAAASPGWEFAGWEGACAGQGATCDLTLDADTAVGARFAEPLAVLTVTRSGAGSGRVVGSPPGIDCGSACSAGYLAGTAVLLAADPDPGSTFAGWSGDGDCADGAVTLAAATACTASFAARSHAVAVDRQGSGAGRVTSAPPGLDCGDVCLVPFAAGTAVALNAVADPGSTFAGWSGDPDCADGALSVSGDRACVARFETSGATGDETRAGVAAAQAGGGTWLAVAAPATGDRDGDGWAAFALAQDPGGPWTEWPGAVGIAGPSAWRIATFTGLAPGTEHWLRVTWHDPDGVLGDSPQVVGPVATAAAVADAVTLGAAAVEAGDEELLVALPIAGDDDGDATATVAVARTPDGPWETRCGPPLSHHPKLCRLRALEPGARYWVRVTGEDPDGVAGDNPQVVGPVAFAGALDLAALDGGQPVLADPGWGCCADPAALVDGRIQAADWQNGFAWSGGTGGWGGEPAGWKQAVVDLGAPRRFDRVRFWTHDPVGVPAAWEVAASDDPSTWSTLFAAAQPVCRTADAPLATSWGAPACALEADFAEATARYVRLRFDDTTLFEGIHGWAAELEVLASAGCGFTVPASTAVPAGGGVGSLAVAAPPGCVWLASAEASWLAVQSPAGGDGDGNAGFVAAANPSTAERRGELVVAGRRVVVVQPGAPCTVGLAPSSAGLPAAGGAGQLTVTVPAGCPWEAASSASWLILATAAGSGPGTVDFAAEPNAGAAPRQASIAVGEAEAAVTQEGWVADPKATVVGAATVLAGGATWIAVAAPFAGDPDGDGWTGFELGTSQEGPWTPWQGRDGAAGPAGPPAWRTAVFSGLDPGSTYFVRATAWDPDGVLGDNPQVLGPATTAATVEAGVTVGTATAEAADDEVLVTLAISGDDDRTSLATVESGPSADGPWTVRCGPEGPFAPKRCRVRGLASGSLVWLRVSVADEGGVSGTTPQVLGPVVAGGRENLALGRAVAADPGWGCCADPAALVDGIVQPPGEEQGFAWTGGTGGWAGGAAGWKQATVDLGGRLTFDRVVAWPHDPAAVAGDWRFEVSDDGVAFSPLAAELSPPCRTEQTPLATGWDFPACAHALDLDPPATARHLRYAFDDTTLFAGRHGWAVELEVLSECGYGLAPAGAAFGEAGGAGSVAVAAAAGCAWEAASEAPWLTVLAGGGTGSGPVDFAVAANVDAAPRAGILRIAGRRFQVDQEAASCPVSLTPAESVFAATGGPGSIAVATPAGCAWTAASDAPWVTIVSGSGSGPGIVLYQAASHGGGAPRTAAIAVGGAAASVHQNPAACSFAIAPTGATVGGSGGGGEVAVDAPAGCAWTAAAQAPWLTVTHGVVGDGDGTVAWTAERNFGPARAGTIAVAQAAFGVDQPCRDTAADGGFEAGRPSPRWIESSTHQAVLLCDPSRCGFSGAASGSGWAWLGGIEGEAETAALDQILPVPEGAATLRFLLHTPAAGGGGPADRLRVRVDGIEVFAVAAGDPPYAAGYAPAVVDLAPFADGAVHRLRFEATAAGAVPLPQFFLDEVAVEGCLPSDVLFADGFESGGLAGWSAAAGPGT